MAGPDRAIAVLKLFTLDSPIWTVEQAAASLGVSASSAYTLGPAIIQYDRQIQITDPLLRAAKPVMADIMRFAPSGSTVLLCRIFRETVLCVHQLAAADRPSQVSYERGRPMPLFRGATSKIILAHLAPRDLRRVYDANSAAVAAAGLGETWDIFRPCMTQMRRAGHAITRAELDARSVGIAAPILDDGRKVLGSLSYVIPLAEERMTARLASLAMTGAAEIEQAMRDLSSKY